jgi:three-Cys-motif partner protein
MTERLWGFWTRGKLDLLRDYLDAFTTASKQVSERVYIDIFAGRPTNSDRLTGEEISGSALIACQTANPPFTRLRFIELAPSASRLCDRLRVEFPNRDIVVYEGDCNQRIGQLLRGLRPFNWAPTFAFVDPNGPDAEWSTLRALATHKRSGLSKVELWLLFPDPQFVRLLPTSSDQGPREQDIDRITRMFGTDRWMRIYGARSKGKISPSQAKEEYVNLMRWRLESVLDYRWTHPLLVKNEANRPIYTMIFATDNEAGTRIMSHLYARAAAQFPAMRKEARLRRREIEDERRGIRRLFSVDELDVPVDPHERFYEHQPPWDPDESLVRK